MTEPGCQGRLCVDGTCTKCQSVPDHVWATWKRKCSVVLDAAVVAEENRQLVNGLQRVGVLSREPKHGAKPQGSSPALAIQCPVCSAPVGVYCVKPNGERQIIAHKKRSEAARAERRARGGL